MKHPILIFILAFYSLLSYSQDIEFQNKCNKLITDYIEAKTFKAKRNVLNEMNAAYNYFNNYSQFVENEDERNYFFVMCDYAKLNMEFGNYILADNVYQQFLGNYTFKEDDKKVARQNQLNVWLREGKYTEVISTVNNGENIIPTTKEDKINAQLILAEAYYSRNNVGDVDKAFAIMEHLYKERESLNDSMYVKVLNNLGLMCASFTGERLKTAYTYLKKGIRLFNNKKDKDYYSMLANLAYTEGKLGYWEYTQNHNKEAQAFFKDARNHIKEACDRQYKDYLNNKKDNHYITSLWKKAMILYWQSQAEKSVKKRNVVDAFKSYFTAQKNYILSNFTTMPEHERMSLWAAQYEPLSACYLVAKEDPAFAYEVALFVKNLGMIGNKTMDKSFSKKLRMTPDDIKPHLGKNDVAVEWIETEISGDSTFVALILNKDGKVKCVPTIKKKDLMNFSLSLSGVTKPFYSALSSQNSDDKEFIYSNKVLGDSIWGKVIRECHIKPNTNIYFAPTGLFNLFAIEYLPLGKACPEQGRSELCSPEHPWSARRGTCNFYRLSSTGELVKVTTKSKKSKYKTLLVGGVDYNDYAKDSTATVLPDRTGYETMRSQYLFGRDRVFTYLYGAEREVDSIYHKLDSTTTTLVKGENATERFVKNNLNKYDIVHLSTHGYSLDFIGGQVLQRDSLMQDQLMMRTGIAFAGANVAGQENPHAEDGILTAKEISQMNLSNVKLVVLSACQTAVAKMTDEEVASISRAFKKAGVGTLIVSLWSTGDDASQVFFTKFYDNLKHGQSVSKAFKNAREYIKNAGTIQINYSGKLFSPRTLSYVSRQSNTISKKDVEISKHCYYDSYILIDANK